MAQEKPESTLRRYHRVRVLASVVALGAALLALGYHLTREPGPRFQGRSVMAWVMELESSPQARQRQAEAALRSLGSDAVPTLIHTLSGRESLFLKPLLALRPILPGLVWRQLYRLFRPYEAEHGREMAARALGVLGQDAQSAIPVLCRALQSPSTRVSMSAADALTHMGKPAVPLLAGTMRGTNTHATHLAGTALAAIGPEAGEAIPTLIDTLKSTSAEARQGAGLALAGVGPAALPLLAASIESIPSDSRDEVLRAMAAIGTASYEGLLALVEVSKHPSPVARLCAVTALGKTGPLTKRLVLAVNAALLDPNESVRLSAIAALYELETRAVTNATPNLRALIKDKSDNAKSAARHAPELMEAAPTR